MIASVEAGLAELGVHEEVRAVGQFLPRGHTGAMLAGGLADVAGGDLGGVAVAGGALAGARLHDSASGLPERMLVGVTATHVYGFAAAHRGSAVGALVFALPLSRLEVHVHGRMNVRVVELVDRESGARVELEGNRLPVTHSKDVIDVLRG